MSRVGWRSRHGQSNRHRRSCGRLCWIGSEEALCNFSMLPYRCYNGSSTSGIGKGSSCGQVIETEDALASGADDAFQTQSQLLTVTTGEFDGRTRSSRGRVSSKRAGVIIRGCCLCGSMTVDSRGCIHPVCLVVVVPPGLSNPSSF
jgi:hypothetical protein